MVKKIKTSKVVLISIFTVGLVLAGVALAYAVKQSHDREIQQNSLSAENKRQKSQIVTSKDSTAPESSSSKSTSDNAPLPATTTPLANTTLTIKSFSQQNGSVTVSASANTKVSGTCYYIFSSEGAKPVNKSSMSALDNTNQLCNISISEVEFTKIGAWHLSVVFDSPNGKVEVSQNVTIN